MERKEKIALWDEKQEETCGYCIYAERIPERDEVRCRKYGDFMKFQSTCKKFKFDILKKELRRKKRPNFAQFSSEDFTL